MRHRYLGGALLGTALAFSLAIASLWTTPESAAGVEASAAIEAAAETEQAQELRQVNGECSELTVPEENHASIRLRVDSPANEEEVAVDERGEITVGGVLHKHATMVDVSDEEVTTSDFTFSPPLEGDAAWAQSWFTSLRPPHLGENAICARAERDPKRSAKILRNFTVVDLTPPSDVPDLAVGDVSSTSATVTWGAGSDNYGLAGYEVTVDGVSAERTTVDTRSYTITRLEPSTSHTVSVVAIDLAGNTSTTPSTVAFTTEASSPPPSDSELTFEPEEGSANAFWDADDPAGATYRVFLNERLYDTFDRGQYCEDENGDPAIPCTTQDMIGYPIAPLELGTLYTVRVEVLGESGALERTMRGSFTTMTIDDSATRRARALIATESSRCSGMGGDFYVAPDARAAVSLPAGSSEVFAGCHVVQDSSCLDAFIPLSGDQIVECVDDLTGLLHALAPPGGGPVISSLDDARNLGTSSVKVTSVSWCHDGACALVLAPVAQVADVVDMAPRPVLVRALVVTPFAIGVAAAAVGGAAIGVVLSIIFAEEAGTLGLLEYPVDAATDFDTYDNWGLSKGEYYHSLQIYAEVIKTTNQIALRDNLLFGWGSSNDADLKSLIDTVCSVQQGADGASWDGCGSGFAVYVPGAKNYKGTPMPETGRHIATAMTNTGHPWPVERYQWHYPKRSIGGHAAISHGYIHKTWFNLARFRPNPCFGKPVGDVCDEFPFWTTNQAVDLTNKPANPPGGNGVVASRHPVPKSEASPQGVDLAGFYRECTVGEAESFVVLPIEGWVAAEGTSFGFEVTDNGTSLCLGAP